MTPLGSQRSDASSEDAEVVARLRAGDEQAVLQSLDRFEGRSSRKTWILVNKAWAEGRAGNGAS
jgi:hypothetical protein